MSCICRDTPPHTELVIAAGSRSYGAAADDRLKIAHGIAAGSRSYDALADDRLKIALGIAAGSRSYDVETPVGTFRNSRVRCPAST